MKIYLVGGAVRDKLLGTPVKERDWVVVGATEQEMIRAGYKQVGKDFPVFLHPKTGEEYALARTERKVGPGYKGFTVDTSTDVTLEEDLERRDLTINAMAETNEGLIIDPYHGQEDLKNKILRHVSKAFAEDPVRILRVGRFLARYAHQGFTVAAETLTLMRNMVQLGEVNALVPERVFKELERALQEKNPEKFFAVLDDCGALPILFPYLTMKGHGMKALIAASHLTEDPVIRFAALFHAIPEDRGAEPKKIILELCHRYRVPNEYKELALLTATHYSSALKAQALNAEQLLTLFSACDLFRRQKRFKQFLLTCQAIANSQHLLFDCDWLAECATAAQQVSVQELIKQGFEGIELANKIKHKRLEKIAEYIARH